MPIQPAPAPAQTPAEPSWLAVMRESERLFDAGQHANAVELAQGVLETEPNCAAAHQVIGCALSRAHKPVEAIARLEIALALRPDLAPSHNDMGMSYAQLGDHLRALKHYESALAIQPDHAFARFNRALALLQLGRFREGWLEYEWRWNCGLVARPETRRPRWDGRDLGGRGVLIHTEQGMGDVLQFVRFLPLARERGARVVFGCQTPLRPLLRGIDGVDEWFPIGEPAPITFDVYLPMMSLPLTLGLDTEEKIRRPVPYVWPDPAHVEKWRVPIGSLGGFKVGLCWQGSPTFKGDAIRSIPLRHYAPLAKVLGVRLVSLQKGPGEEQIPENADAVPMTVLENLDADGAFMDTAAVMRHLDLIVTSDTAVAHLAGAMGRPVWVMLSTAADWRFMAGRSDSPWYPTMRLFRQESLGDWEETFAEAAAALEDLARSGFSRPGVPA